MHEQKNDSEDLVRCHISWIMMSVPFPVILSTAAIALFLNQVTVQQPQTELTPEREHLLFRTCRQADEDARNRCEARQLRRAGIQTHRSSPVGAYEVYDAMDMGKIKLRAELRAQKRIENARHWAANRETYLENPVQQSSALQPRSYVDEIREERLRCMLEPHGRPRSLCLDQLGNRMRLLMRERSGSRQTPAQ